MKRYVKKPEYFQRPSVKNYSIHHAAAPANSKLHQLELRAKCAKKN